MFRGFGYEVSNVVVPEEWEHNDFWNNFSRVVTEEEEITERELEVLTGDQESLHAVLKPYFDICGIKLDLPETHLIWEADV